MAFNILEIEIINMRCHFIFRKNYITFRPQFGSPKILRTGADVPLCPPPLVTPLLARVAKWVL